MRRVVVVAGMAFVSLLLLAPGRFGTEDDETPAAPAGYRAVAAVDARDQDAPAKTADGDVWIGQMKVKGDRALTSDTRLQNLTMTARDVLIGADGLHAGTLTLQALVPYAVVAHQIGPDVTVSAASNGEARISRRVDLLGHDVNLSGTGTVRVEAGQLVMEPTSIDIGGPAWLGRAAGDVARRLVTIRHPVDGLPKDLELQEVSVADAGFTVTLHGENVRLGG
jgi:LmeA-like phospholipid-binding